MDLSGDSVQNKEGENCAHFYARFGLTQPITKMMEIASAYNKGDQYLANILLQKDHKGNSPLMSAALYEQSESLSRLLLFYYGAPEITFLEEMLHTMNEEHASIFEIVNNSSKIMLGPQGTLLELEKKVVI